MDQDRPPTAQIGGASETFEADRGNQWLKFARETTAASAVSASLPHRSPEEQAQIAACFAGVTTWQRVCIEFGLDATARPDECKG